MNKFPIVLVLAAWFIVGCNNDLDLVAPQKDIPVVYGVWTKNETEHYLRVERAFIDENTDAITLAGNSENYTYDNIVVQARKLNDGLLLPLERVDGNLEGLQRDAGIFATDPNVLYKLSTNFAGGQDVELLIDRGDGSPVVTSLMNIISDIDLKTPNPDNGSTVDVRPDRNYIVTFEPPAEAKIFDVDIVFEYYEFSPSGVRTPKEVVWNFASNVIKEDSDQFFRIEREGFGLFSALSAAIQPEQGVTRQFRKFRFEVVGGGEALKEFIRLTQANTGITSAQEVPNFSNLSEGLGIFSSEFTLVVDSMDIKNESYEEILNFELTSDLGFL